MKVGVFIITHWHDSKFGNYRHGINFGENRIDRFKYIIDSYKYYNSGEDQTVFVMDAESNLESFTEWIPTVDHVKHTPVKNIGGSHNSIKYCMFDKPEMMDEFDYFLFHTDDSVQVADHNWATDIIEEYESTPILKDNGGVLGRIVRFLRFSKDGLMDKDGCAKHFARMWKIEQPIWIPILNADWTFMNKKTIKRISEIWYDPISCKECMEYQIELENTNSATLSLLDYQTSQTSSKDLRWRDFHVGREIEFITRLRNFGMDGVASKTEKIIFGGHMAERK
jgi:hypothetical protein